MQFQSSVQIWVFRTTCDFIDCVWPEWIDAAETNQPMRVLGNLRAGPVIFSDYVRVFLWNRRFVWIREAICDRQYDGSTNSGGIELINQVICVDTLRS